MAKTYQDGLVKGYKMGVKEGKQEALVELQKITPIKTCHQIESYLEYSNYCLNAKRMIEKPVVAI